MKSPPLKIGAFGTGNLGDDLMLQSILSMEPDCHVVAFGKPLLPFDVPYISHDEFLEAPDRFMCDSGSLDFGGGNLFWSEANLIEMLVLAQKAKLHGLPVNLNRVGLHGADLNKYYSRMLLSVVDRITVRDSQSLDIARKAGRMDALLARDYAFDFLDNYQLSHKFEFPLEVGINFSDIRMTSSDEGFVRHITGVFAELARRFKGVIKFNYLPFCIHRTFSPENDLIVANRFWEESGGEIELADGVFNTDSLVNKVAAMDVLIGYRFHMQVLGYALKKNVIPMVGNLSKFTKHSAIAIDNGVVPVAYEDVSQNFIIDNIAKRLTNIVDDFKKSSVDRVC